MKQTSEQSVNDPLISIITPNYNCEKFIALTIESVLAQTYTNWEMIIQDDCSTDKSYEIALKYAKIDARIKVFKNARNSGAAVTRNNAIEISKGKYLAFLDSDDIWFPEKLEKQLKFMQKENCDFIFSEYEQIDEANNARGIKVNVCSHLTYTKLLMHGWTGCLTVMYDQEKVGKIYTPDIKKNNDRALFLKVLKVAGNARGQKETLALYRIRSGSISRNKWKMIKPYVTVIHEFEKKPLLFAYFSVVTHTIIKKFFKEKKVTAGNFEFLEQLEQNAASRSFAGN